MNFEQYIAAQEQYQNFLESMANIRADVEECRENPPVILNKEYDIHNVDTRSDASGDSVSEEVLDSTLESWVSKTY